MAGVKVQGIECPFIHSGDDVAKIVADAVLNEYKFMGGAKVPVQAKDGGIAYEPIWLLNDQDVIGITESVIARAAGQYITVDDIAIDIEKKFGKGATIVLVHPIYSRNRFSLILKGIARSASKVIIVMPDYDEVGNPRGVNPFTGVNIEKYYKELCESENCDCEITYFFGDPIIQNNFRCFNFIDCCLHNWEKKHIAVINEENLCTLADICSDKSPDWGLLGTNKATEEKLKLFPSKDECIRVSNEVKKRIKEVTGKDIIVCIYADGCFKDPVGGIWEFADPISMPGYTDRELIESSPNEYKLKYLIDSGVPDEVIKTMHVSAVDNANNKMGTTPRICRDLLASLMDLTSGSGDRCTPIIVVQNYFR